MKFWKQTLPFLLLNIIVSAAAVYAILYFWERSHPLPDITSTLPAPTQNSSAAVAAPTQPPTNPDALLTIEGVFGAGDVSVEYVLLRNQSEGSLVLSGWRLSGSPGLTYTFPKLTLNPGGAVRLYSKFGSDSVIELFWNQEDALWQSGASLSLVNPTGETQATYTIP